MTESTDLMVAKREPENGSDLIVAKLERVLVEPQSPEPVCDVHRTLQRFCNMAWIVTHPVQDRREKELRLTEPPLIFPSRREPIPVVGRGAPHDYSITSSAIPSTRGDIARFSALAVRKLITSSNFVGC